MVRMRWWSGVVVLSLVGSVMAEPPEEGPESLANEPPITKPEERAKFHGETVRGTSAGDRLHAWERTLDLRKASYFEGVKWRNVGPEVQGGRVIDIAAPTSDPKSLYVAYATGGLFRTEDEGETWTSIFEDQSSFGIGAIAVSADGQTLWVGTGEANSQRTSYAGTGVYKSTDRGKTWRNVGLLESHHIGKILIDPRNPNVVYVAVLGHLYSQNPERGVYKTTDGGATWAQVLKVDEFTGSIDLAMDPSDANIVYASMWDRDRRAWNFRESGVGSAVYRTANGGKVWSKVRGLPEGNAAGRIGLATSAADPAVVYAFCDNQDNDSEWAGRDEGVEAGRFTPRRFLRLTDETFPQVDSKLLSSFLSSYEKAELKAEEAQEAVRTGKRKFADILAALKKAYPDRFSGPTLQAEVYRSSDHGKTWVRTSYLGAFGGGYYWGKTFANPANANEVYVTGLPLLRSLDGGKSWKSVAEEAHVDHHAMWFDPRTKGKTWIGNDGGLYVSADSGDHVRHVNNVSVAQATTVAVDNQRPYNIIVGNQDNGTMRGPSTYKPGESDKDLWKDLFGGDGSAIAVDPRDNGTKLIVSYQFGQFFMVGPTGGSRFISPRGKDKDDVLRYNWIAPVVISTHNPDIIYIGSQRLHRSLDGATKWTDISGDLTKNLPNGDVPYSTLKDLSESPLRFGLIYAAADDGTVSMTPDGGYQWVNINTPQPKKWVSRIVASRYDVNVVYCAQSGYREDDFSAYLWRSADQGRTWTSIVGDLPDQTINVVREDPKDAKTLYIGTDVGAYVSFDAGAHWQALHGGLPTLPVHDLAIQEREDELVAATHARGAYVLPLKRIRAFGPKLLEAPITILEAADMTRGARWGRGGASAFERKLPESPKLKGGFFARDAGTVIVRIKDAAGKIWCETKSDGLRGYNDFEVTLETKAGTVPPETLKLDPAKTVADALADPFAAFRPEYLPAGKYTLEIQVGSVTVSQAWELRGSG